MSDSLRVLLVISAVYMLFFILKRIRDAKLKIEYIVFWVIFSILLVIMGIFPTVFYKISRLIGFQSPINMVFLIVIFVLIVKNFFMTIQISQLENKIDNLVQQIAIDRKIDKEDKINEDEKV